MATFSLGSGISRVRTDYGDVILDEAKGIYWHANPTAVLVLDTVEHGGGLEEAAERLMAEFGIDRSTARSDAETLLGRLRDLGVVQ
ncbi:lasso peptide biosynthesis PqqD family chaperone [Nocardiopsis rhodophaea]|uniref:lasso peptide biosynthesis PqqD family chaperone n=1 Tax=Nocardiopsis rhodophaea TaxID=280238 RepID=UPI0031E21486